MPVVAAVLTLDPDRQSELIGELQREPRLMVGEPRDNKLPVVLDTQTGREDRLFWKALIEHRGVLHIDYAMAHLGDDV